MPHLAEIATALLLLVGCCSSCRAHAFVASPCGHCCHDGHYCAMGNASWLLGWIIYVKRASLVWLMLSGLILYYIPETRAPVKRGCHLFIDIIANNLKTFIGKLDDGKEIDEGELKKLFISKTFMDEFSSCLPHSNLKKTKSFNLTKKQDCASVSFNLPEKEVLRERRHKSRVSQQTCKDDSQTYRQLQYKIHQPCSKKFKEKSSHDKVSVYPVPLMQFDNSERQNLKTSYALSNDNCGPCLPSNYDHEEVMNSVPLIKEKYCLSNTYSYVRMRSANECYKDSLSLKEDFPKKKYAKRCQLHKDLTDENKQSSFPRENEILNKQPTKLKSNPNHPCKFSLKINENKSIVDKQILQTEPCKSPLIRALNWIFGESPTSKYQFCHKSLAEIVQERLSDFI